MSNVIKKFTGNIHWNLKKQFPPYWNVMVVFDIYNKVHTIMYVCIACNTHHVYIVCNTRHVCSHKIRIIFFCKTLAAPRGTGTYKRLLSY